MKKCLLFIAVIAWFNPTSVLAQDSGPYDLDTLLRDASYVFNRFEELSTGTAAQINSYPIEVRKSSKDTLSAVMANVDKEKPALNALLGHSKISSVELLDVYTEIVEVAGELKGDSTSSMNWGDQKLGIDLEQLSAKANVLGAKLAVTLRSQIGHQESQLALCTARSGSSHK